MRATSNLKTKAQTSKRKPQIPEPQISSIKHRAEVCQFKTSVPSVPHSLDRRSEIPRALVATVGRTPMPKGLNRWAREGGFSNFVPPGTIWSRA